jgi:MarR family 2-MHQ and catechol resistance regulon transcriptional repressor
MGTRKETRALNAFIKLVRAAESVAFRTRGVISGAKLTESQFGVLEVLLHLGPMCQVDLGKKILKSGGNITMVVDNLEKRDLVERRRDEKDRRYITVYLTEEGKRLIESIFPSHVEGIHREMNILSAGEQEELGRLCRKLGTRKA